ncbi:MAG: nucleoside-diphosphate-sugar epimerase [Rhodocyclaceae bacterium]|nr:MAG: nucleoside-diphosphate-sugar epimerase [Rhodocyclaceae bacterium]TND05591.1 MAG: nucleoside-diphosphate-sugar epimerase [Rhodocyclaceae bacterium]
MVLNRIGLTGATGMLGRHIRAALEHEGAQVIAVGRGTAADGEAGTWDLANWLATEQFDTMFPGVQAVVHAGAMVQTAGPVDQGLMFDTNVRACVNLAQWAISRGVPVVHISSATVYEDIASGELQEDAATGWSGLGGFYGLSKLLAEDALKRLCRQGLKLAIVRPSSLYGFGLPETKMVSRFLATASAGAAIELIPPVNDRIDFVHAADVALAILAILRAEAWETFNIASGSPLSVRELAEACVSVAGQGNIVVDEIQAVQHEPVTRFGLDIGRAKHRLGWQPQSDIRQGLDMMLRECVHAGSRGLPRRVRQEV